MKAMRPESALGGGGAPRRMSSTYQAATGSVTRRASLIGGPSSRSIESRRLAAAREAGIEPRDVDERNAEPAEPDGEADRRVLRQRDLGARAMQSGKKTFRAELGEHLDGGQVQRLLQRLARRHRALKALIEIFGRIGAVARRTVEEQGLGMGEALFEGERIDEGFQRRTRRALARATCRSSRRARRRDSRPRRRARGFRRLCCRSRRSRPRAFRPSAATLDLRRAFPVSPAGARRSSAG